MHVLPRLRLTVSISVGPLLGICLGEIKNARVPFFGNEADHPVVEVSLSPCHGPAGV
jgi:hypothetical protein